MVTLIVWQPITSVYVPPATIQLLLSVTLTAMGNVPVCVGVPLSVPFEFSVSPVGKVLDVLNATGVMPPICVNVWLKNVPAVPVVVAGFDTMMVAQLLVKEKLTAVDAPFAAALTV